MIVTLGGVGLVIFSIADAGLIVVAPVVAKLSVGDEVVDVGY